MSVANLVIYGKYNDFDGQSLNLDRIRDGGTPTVATEGSPSISDGGHLGTGALVLVSNFMLGQRARLDYSGVDIVDSVDGEGCIEFFVAPANSGTPNFGQYFVGIGNDGNEDNLACIRHATNGDLIAELFDDDGGLLASASANFDPAAGTYYHLCMSWSGSVLRLFIDGMLQVESNYVDDRSSDIDLLRLGAAVQDSTDAFPEFTLDELRIYDSVRRTANFTPPTEELNADVWAPLLRSEVKDKRLPILLETWVIKTKDEKGAEPGRIRFRRY